MADVKPIPDGYHSITPAITLSNCSDAIAFYEKALGAEELDRSEAGDGRIMHAELKIGDSRIMVNDPFPEMSEVESVQQIGASPISLWIYVADCDAAFLRAVAAGCEEKMKPKDMFWGDRYGRVIDPFGLEWSFATRIEELTKEEIEARQAELFGGGE